MSSNKVLILTNPLNHEGGVVNYYNLFFKHFESNVILLKHSSIGSRAYLFYYPILKRLLYPIYYVFDVIAYILKLLFNPKIKIVQVSPSLIPVPLIRDGLLVIIAKILGKKVVVFYRGWKLPTYRKIEKYTKIRKLFNYVFQKNTLQIVLASAFKNDLIKLNPGGGLKIQVTTTVIDKNQIIPKKKKDNFETINVLFLARIQNLKGIGELIDAICKLKENNQLYKFNFTIVGHEYEPGYINLLQDKLEAANITQDQVIFTGRKIDKEKFKIYAQNDIYLLPSYTEGCPNSVLEALSAGLFCITTNVGALDDIIIDKENGLKIKKKSVDHIVNALNFCANNKSVLLRSDKISKESIQQFDVKEIVATFNSIYMSLIYPKPNI